MLLRRYGSGFNVIATCDCIQQRKVFAVDCTCTAATSHFWDAVSFGWTVGLGAPRRPCNS